MNYKYRNPFAGLRGAEDFITTKEKPIDYLGYQIFKRGRNGEYFDIVKDGKGVTLAFDSEVRAKRHIERLFNAQF